MTHIPVYDLIDVQEAARIANVTPSRIYKLIHHGTMASEKRAGRVFVLRREAQAFADRRARRAELGIPLRQKYETEPLTLPVEVPETNVGAAFESALQKQPVSPLFGPKLPQPTPPVVLAPAPQSDLATLREKIKHELGAIRHQAAGIDDQIKELETRALQFLAQEEEYAKRLAQIEELEAFAKTID